MANTKSAEPGFRADGSAFPGVDPETGERKAVTYDGLKEEFGPRVGARLYNDIAVAAFGGVQASRPALSIRTLEDDRAQARRKDESEEAYADRLEKRARRRERVMKLLSDAEGVGDGVEV